MISRSVYNEILMYHEKIEKINIIKGRPNLLQELLRVPNFKNALYAYIEKVKTTKFRGRPRSTNIDSQDEAHLVATSFITDIVLPMWYRYTGRSVIENKTGIYPYKLDSNEKNSYRNIIDQWFKNDAFISKQIDPFAGKNGKYVWLDVFSALNFSIHLFSKETREEKYFQERFFGEASAEYVPTPFVNFYEEYTKFIKNVNVKRTVGFYVRSIFDITALCQVYACLGQAGYTDTIDTLSPYVKEADDDSSLGTLRLEQEFIRCMYHVDQKGINECLLFFAQKYAAFLCQGKHKTIFFELFDKFLKDNNLIALRGERSKCSLVSKVKYRSWISLVEGEGKFDPSSLPHTQRNGLCNISDDCRKELTELFDKGENDYREYILRLLKWSLYEYPALDVIDALFCDACDVYESKIILWDIDGLNNDKHSYISDMRNKLLAALRILVILNVLSNCESITNDKNIIIDDIHSKLQEHGLNDLLYGTYTYTEGYQFDWCVSKYLDGLDEKGKR